jgi:hypothetical protein
MATFLVDSRTLLVVRDTLGRLHDQLLGMHTVIWSYWGVLGGRELEGELEHFCGTWHYGVTQLAADINGLMGRLTGAAAAYERIERRITAAGTSHPAGGSGTTVIGGGSSTSRRPRQSGSGVTVIGGGPTHPAAGRAVGSGTTVIDERTARPQRTEPEAALTLRRA